MPRRLRLRRNPSRHSRNPNREKFKTQSSKFACPVDCQNGAGARLCCRPAAAFTIFQRAAAGRGRHSRAPFKSVNEPDRHGSNLKRSSNWAKWLPVAECPEDPEAYDFGKSAVFVPEGPCENSPAFQRWVVRSDGPKSRRDGRSFLSSLRDSFPILPEPSVETLGYCRMSLRDKLLSEYSNGIRTKRE